MGTGKVSILKSNELMKIPVFLSYSGVIDALCREFILGLASITVSQRCYENYKDSTTSGIVLEK